LTADKNIANVSKHGVDMSAAAEFDFETAVTWTDTRKIYGETRTIAVGFIAHRLHVLVFTMRGRKLRLLPCARQIAKKAPPIMTKDKRPRHVSPKDWDAVDSPALSDDILAAMRPARETFHGLAEASAKRKRGERGPQKKPRKVLISLRVEAGTLEAFKAKGRGYQTRMAAVLKKAAKQS